MKTQVIHLEPHDDVVSVRDKMSWAKTERILLVIPRGTALRARTLDFRLLQRHANSVGARLGIVTRVDEIRAIARELGLPVFSRLVTARRKAWPVDQILSADFHQEHEPADLSQLRREAYLDEATWRRRDWVRITFFSLATLAILTVLFIFIPSAIIQINPATRFQSLDIQISSNPQVETADLQGRLPARLVSQIVERTKSIPATGSAPIPEAFANGAVQFRNLTDSAVTIPSGTVVTTQSDPPLRFMTTAEVEVAAGFGETTDINVKAVLAGTSGNLPAGKLVAMEANLGTSLSVTNLQPTTGGTDRMTDIPTEMDRASLYSTLQAELLNECKTDLQGSLKPGDVYYSGTLTVTKTLAETYFPAVGQPGDTLSLTLRQQCQAQYAALEDITSLAGMLLNVEKPDGYILIPGSMVIEPAAPPVTGSDGDTLWQVQVNVQLEAQVDPGAVAQLSLGQRPEKAAQRLLESLPINGLPDIDIRPPWWPWLPLLPFNITVTVGG